MKSGINRVLFLFLLFLFSAFNVRANVHSICSDVTLLTAYCQDVTSAQSPQVDPDTTNRGRKNATPIIILNVVPIDGRIAQLSWTTSDPSIPGIYNVERYDIINGWVVFGPIQYDAILEFNDTISYPNCTSTDFTYRIRFISELDNTTSSEVSVNLYDQNSPAEVQNLVVSITSTMVPILTWTTVTGDEIFGYRIQRFIADNQPWQTITTVAPGSNSFVDNIPLTEPDACAKSYRYAVSTIDRCGNYSEQLLYDDKAVQTIKLNVPLPAECSKSAELTWNSYIHMPGGMGGYEISINEGNTNILVFNTKDTTMTTYVHNYNFKDGITYTYSINAYSKDGLYTSSSCQVDFTYNGAIVPDTVDITQVTVENDSLIRVVYHLYPAGSVQTLILERSDDGGTSFQAIDTLAFSGVSVPQDSSFIDTTANVHAQSYHYRLVAIDYCLDPKTSLTSQSIYLDCFTSETENTLQWNKYEYWINGVKEYDIYRALTGTPPTILLLDSVDQNTVSFNDPLTSYDNSKAVCYWIEGTENPGNYLNNTISVSNTCCIIKEPVLYLPNAFRPDGTNNLFRPVPEFLYVDTQSFKMIIFSRWGQQLFETTDIINGWNGTINGQNAPTDQYSYIITYKSLADKEYTKRGTVTLIR